MSYPLLKYSELAYFVQHIGAPMTIDELKAPKAEQLRHVYDRCVAIAMGYERDQFKQLPSTMLVSMPYFSNAWEDCLAETAMTAKILRLLRYAGVNDCSMRDIYEPEPLRTRQNLSAISNFICFCDESLSKPRPTVVEAEQLNAQREQLLEEHEKLQQALHVTRAMDKENEAYHARLKEELRDHENHISEAQRKFNKLSNDFRLRKDEVKRLGTREHELQEQIEEVRKESAALRSQIVRSPQKLQRSLADMTNQQYNEQNEIINLQYECRKLKNQNGLAEKLHNKLVKRIRTLQEIEQEQSHYKRVVDDTKTQHTKLGSLEQQLHELEAKRSLVGQDAVECDRQLQQTQREIQMRKTQEMLRRQLLEEERQQIELDRHTEQQQLDELHMLIEMKKQEIRELDQARDRMRSMMEGKVVELHNALTAWQKRVNGHVVMAELSGGAAAAGIVLPSSSVGSSGSSGSSGSASAAAASSGSASVNGLVAPGTPKTPRSAAVAAAAVSHSPRLMGTPAAMRAALFGQSIA